VAVRDNPIQNSDTLIYSRAEENEIYQQTDRGGAGNDGAGWRDSNTKAPTPCAREVKEDGSSEERGEAAEDEIIGDGEEIRASHRRRDSDSRLLHFGTTPPPGFAG
jgi:hypothetical protein